LEFPKLPAKNIPVCFYFVGLYIQQELYVFFYFDFSSDEFGDDPVGTKEKEKCL
jgi:hypothetical protein